MRLSFQGSEFPDAVDCVLDMESECLEELNKLCQAIQQLSTDEIKKLGAVVEYARPETAHKSGSWQRIWSSLTMPLVSRMWRNMAAT